MRTFVVCAAAVALVGGIAIGMGWLTMTVWNAILVPWLNAPALNLWLATAVYVVLMGIFQAVRGSRN